MVHSDLKPDNIMINQTEDGYIPKIIDFGFTSKIYEDFTGGTIIYEDP